MKKGIFKKIPLWWHNDDHYLLAPGGNGGVTTMQDSELSSLEENGSSQTSLSCSILSGDERMAFREVML